MTSVPCAEVIGDPIAQSKSPAIHLFWLEKLGMEGDYRRAHVRAAELERYLDERRHDAGWRGCNVTIPHKQSILPMLDDVQDQGIGAVNCVTREGDRLIGRNTDAAGVGEALGEIDAGSPVAMIGAGGAARAAIAALKGYGVPEVRIVARDGPAARGLLREFGVAGEAFAFADAAEALSGCGGAINASPLGMNGYPEMPDVVLEALSSLPGGSFALDMVYAPLRTAFLDRAEAAGMRPVDGLAMLIGQAAHAFRLFFGAEAPREHDAELRALLTS
jgi:shikimate dehydrogenase